MAVKDPDPTQHILAIDPGHKAWIDGIGQACGLDKPSLGEGQPNLFDNSYLRKWSFLWLVRDPDKGVGAENFGVRIEQAGQRYSCVIRGPQGTVSLENWRWFPGPDTISQAAMMAGFDW
jgi:hypothetical protein